MLGNDGVLLRYIVTMRKGGKKMIGGHKCSVAESQNDEVIYGPLETPTEEAEPQDEVAMEKENDTGEEDRGKNKPAKPDSLMIRPKMLLLFNNRCTTRPMKEVVSFVRELFC